MWNRKKLILCTVFALTASLFAATSCGTGGGTSEDIRIGALATLEGPFTALGEDSIRGVRLALSEFAPQSADDEDLYVTPDGTRIRLITASSDANPDRAVREARNLVEQDNVDILVGPLSGDEGIAVKNYAKTVPNVTFLNGASAAQDTTLRDPADNFFRFSTDGAQWMAGLGAYIYNELEYRNIAVLAEDYSFPYTQVQGLLLPFCELGGTVQDRQWVPIGHPDFSSVIARFSAVADELDAIYVALGGADAVNFLTQYEQSGGDLLPIVGGSITVDQSVLSTEGRIRETVIGTPSAGPVADTLDTPAWRAFVEQYRNAGFADAFPSPSLFAHANYINTKALLLALEEVNYDISDNGARLREELADVSFDTPTGRVSLDHNRQAIADIYITEVFEQADGTLATRVVETVSQVNQTLGIPEAEFLANGVVGRNNPACN